MYTTKMKENKMSFVDKRRSRKQILKIGLLKNKKPQEKETILTIATNK